MIRIGVASALAAVCVAAPTKPLVLIFQESVGVPAEADISLDVMRPLAEALEQSGKLHTATWSKEDVLVAAALRDGAIKLWPEPAQRKDVFSVARALQADYVAVCTVSRLGPQATGKIELFRSGGGRRIWSGETTVSILKNDRVDLESSAQSVASTWAAQLITIPFKDLPGAPPLEASDPGRPTVVQAPKLELDPKPFENGMNALKDKRAVEAVALLKDAVDIAPFDAEARLGLIEALRLANRPFLAAEEAERAAALMPDRSELVLAAAECWIMGGQPDKAFAGVQAVLEKSPSDPSALSLLGDLLVGRLEYQRAAEKYTESLSSRADPEVYFKRAQAYALLEEFEKSVQDIERANAAGLSAAPDRALRRYQESVRVLDPVFQSLGSAVRNLLREAKGSGAPDTAASRAAELVNRATTFSKYFDRISAPDGHKRSHQQRGLAMNLLLQSAAGLERYTGDNNPETYGDAELLQIEAMREFAAAKDQFLQELGAPRR